MKYLIISLFVIVLFISQANGQTGLVIYGASKVLDKVKSGKQQKEDQAAYESGDCLAINDRSMRAKCIDEKNKAEREAERIAQAKKDSIEAAERRIAYEIRAEELKIQQAKAMEELELKKAIAQKEFEIRQAERDSLMAVREAERLAEQRAWEKKMISTYGKTNGQLIIEGKVKIGFTKQMCIESWGQPYDIYRTTTRYGVSEQWAYNLKSYLYFDDGELTSIQN